MTPFRVVVAHTADVGAEALARGRALMYDVFDDMAEHDWDHALGGMHAIAYSGSELIGHASVVQRRIVHRERALRAGYVEAVAVRADHRRQGVGSALMQPLERIIRASYELGALGATDEAVPFYLRRGWQLWRGRSSVMTPDGVVATPDDDGAIYVLTTSAPVDLDGPITCDWREGDGW